MLYPIPHSAQNNEASVNAANFLFLACAAIDAEYLSMAERTITHELYHCTRSLLSDRNALLLPNAPLPDEVRLTAEINKNANAVPLVGFNVGPHRNQWFLGGAQNMRPDLLFHAPLHPRSQILACEVKRKGASATEAGVTRDYQKLASLIHRLHYAIGISLVINIFSPFMADGDDLEHDIGHDWLDQNAAHDGVNFIERWTLSHPAGQVRQLERSFFDGNANGFVRRLYQINGRNWVLVNP